MTLSQTQKYYLYGLLSSVLVFFLANSTIVYKLNTLFEDKIQQVYSNEVRSDIIIVAIDDASLATIGAWPWNRSVFAELITKIDQSKAKTIGIDVTFLEPREGDFELQEAIDQSQTPVVLASKIANQESLNPILNSPSIGFTNIIQDNDGIVRKTLLNFQVQNEILPSFSQSIYSSYLEHHPKQAELSKWNSELPSQVNFIYESGEFNTVSALDIINNTYNPNDLKDKIVLIGSTAKDLRTGLVDNVSKIGGVRIAGVTLHAYMTSALLNKDLLFPISPLQNVLISLLIILILLYIFKRITKILSDIIIALGLSLIFLILASLVFDKGVIIPSVSYLIIIAGTTIYSLITRYFHEKKHREFISKAFTQYMNPQLLHTLIDKPELLQLGGSKKEMTILFSDIRSFTNLSEALSAEELVSLLNSYLDKMSHVVFDHEGIIDKFIGDAIMCFWNSPLHDPLHAIHGIQTAIAMSEALKEFNNEYDGPNLAVGIGVHTGEVIVGNMGSTKRFDFTVIGDNVNLSARLEGLTKKYGLEIIISEATLSQVSEIPGYITRKIDTMTVKGKNLPVTIYQPLKDTSSNLTLIKNYETGFKDYQAGKMDSALQHLAKNPDDKPSKLLIERIKNDLTPLPKDWDGIWKWTSK